MKLHPARAPLKGSIRVPGDKSISHRAALISALSSGAARIRNYAPGSDCQSTLKCLGDLGVPLTQEETTVTIEGNGLYSMAEPSGVLDAGNSGTTMRLLSGILSGQPFYSVITGDESLRGRPMKRVIAPLREMGAQIWGRDQDGLAPLSIKGGHLQAITYRPEVASAQVKSAVILAGLYAEGDTTVQEEWPTRDHTERFLEFFGGNVLRQGNHVTVKGGQQLQSRDVDVPGDISSAAFLLAAALLVPESHLTVKGVGLNPTRRGILDVLNSMGAHVEVNPSSAPGPEPSADLTVSWGPLRATSIGGHLIPSIIDEIPILAVLATQAQGMTVISGARELRVKESDRLKAISQGLSALGAQVEELPDGLSIKGPTPLRGGQVDSCGDHRIAMALAVGALAAGEPVELLGSECVEVSYPGFFDTLKDLEGTP